jgi:large subunit ribosomal protein L5
MGAPFLKTHYFEHVLPELTKTQGYTNCHQVPKLEKIVINSGFNAEVERSWPEDVAKDISLIAGQKAIITKAKKSISNFKLREGMPVGVKVTLRGEQMYEFLYRLTSIVLPGIRDFQGVPSKLDGRGNYNFGIEDHTIFPEIHSDGGNRKNIGMDITIVTTAKTDKEAVELLQLMGMPFRKRSTSSDTSNN